MSTLTITQDNLDELEEAGHYSLGSVAIEQERPRDEDAPWFRRLRRELNQIIEREAGRLDDAG